MQTRYSSAVLATIAAFSLPAVAEPTKEQLDFFEAKIRPLLADRCYKCHSVEAGKSKGSLTLDTASAALKGGDTGPAVVPGDLERSLLYKAITYTDKDLEMPPTSSGGKLDAQQIADVAAWIKMGAPDPRTAPVKAAKLSGLSDKARAHWAYQPVKGSVAIPANKNRQWCRTPIDTFILQKMEAKDMFPSPDASPEVLLRRAYYDLIGLPPSPADVEAFLADQSKEAWEKVIDRLLASPHYGERWGRHWLDSARYADTIGGDGNVNNGRNDYRYAHAWTYRDYVIRSLNEDKPYNQFIVEQLAADFLYPTTPIGSGSPKAAPTVAAPARGTNSAARPAAALAKNAPVQAAPASPTMQPAMMMSGDSMMMMGSASPGEGRTNVDSVGHPNLAALGFLTVGMRFNNANDLINDRIDVVSKAFLGLTVACARCHDHMFDPIPQADYYSLHGIFSSSTESKDKPIIAMPPANLLAEYKQKRAAIEKENRDIYYREVERWLAIFQGKSLDYLKASLLRDGRSDQGQQTRRDFVREANLDLDFANFFSRVVNPSHAFYGPLKKFQEIRPGEFATQAPRVLGDLQKGSRFSPIIVQALKDANPKSLDDVFAVYQGVIKRMAPRLLGFVKAFQNATTDKAAGYTREEIDILAGPFALVPAPMIDSDWIKNATGGWPNQLQNRARFGFAKLNELELTHPGAPPRAMVMLDKPKAQDSRLLIRGQAGTPGEVVPRHFLSILSPGGSPEKFTNGSGRLELAKAIASKDNPLTARVIVNRVWMHHFGDGFVRTPDDMGTMSEPPTHPELLDYLSHWFMESGWSLKKLHKFIMLSRVYQESSYTRPEYEVLDPENRLLWRANVRRLDFEAVRDSLLVMSGRLDVKVGGQPVNITEEPYSYRRSIYGYIDRGNLSELMGHFDFSDPNMPNSKRTATIVPQQALFLMNSPMAVDVARRVVARTDFKQATSDVSRIFMLYRIMFQRQPTQKEIWIGNAFLQQETKNQSQVDSTGGDLKKKNSDIAKRIADMKKRDNDARKAVQNAGDIVERKPLSPWESYAHSLLFANEFAYVN
jgi:hypothetical protein